MRYVVTHHFTQISKKACPAMIEPEAVALILLAAGRSTRFGVADKLAAPLHGRPLVQHAANTLSPIPFGRHIAVCSSSLPVDFAALGFDVAWLRPGEPLSVSLAAGIARAEATACEACLIVLSDMPFVPRSHFDALLEQYSPPPIATGTAGRPKVPALFGRELWADISRLSVYHGARGLFADAAPLSAPAPCLVPIDSPPDADQPHKIN